MKKRSKEPPDAQAFRRSSIVQAKMMGEEEGGKMQGGRRKKDVALRLFNQIKFPLRHSARLGLIWVARNLIKGK